MNQENQIIPPEDENFEEEYNESSLQTQVYRTGTGIRFFKGYSMNRHAEVDLDKSESALIWIFTLFGLIVGVGLSVSHHLFAGIFSGIFITIAGMLGVGLKAMVKKQNSEDIKTMLMVVGLFIFVFLFIGIIFLLVF